MSAFMASRAPASRLLLDPLNSASRRHSFIVVCDEAVDAQWNALLVYVVEIDRGCRLFARTRMRRLIAAEQASSHDKPVVRKNKCHPHVELVENVELGTFLTCLRLSSSE